jgi:succinoglycan biosynthesis protein ExoW
VSEGGVAVVIPFWQREAGPLRAAIESALRQRNAPPVHVIVADDGSPVPAEAEIAGLPSDRVTVLKGRAGGPAAARNRALDAVPDGCEFVAFLDSDDVWEPFHLERALTALRSDADFFFADHIRSNEAKSRFAASGFGEGHEASDAEKNLFRFRGDLFTTLLEQAPVGTSTVVYRRALLASLRFDPTLRLCEDSLFWQKAARITPRFAFGRDIQVRYGPGNHTPEDWRSEHALRNQLGFARYYGRLRREVQPASAEAQVLRRMASRNRRTFAVTYLALLRASGQPRLGLLLGFLRQTLA